MRISPSRYQQDQINCGSYTHDIVDRSTGSGLVGLGTRLSHGASFAVLNVALIDNHAKSITMLVTIHNGEEMVVVADYPPRSSERRQYYSKML